MRPFALVCCGNLQANAVEHVLPFESGVQHKVRFAKHRPTIDTFAVPPRDERKPDFLCWHGAPAAVHTGLQKYSIESTSTALSPNSRMRGIFVWSRGCEHFVI